MAEKEITIEDLAGMVKRGFDGVGERFNEIDERFDKMDEKFKKVDERFDKVDEKFKMIDERFLNINARLEIIEGDLKEIKEEGAKKFEIEDLDARLKVVEEKLGIIS